MDIISLDEMISLLAKEVRNVRSSDASNELAKEYEGGLTPDNVHGFASLETSRGFLLKLIPLLPENVQIDLIKNCFSQEIKLQESIRTHDYEFSKWLRQISAWSLGAFIFSLFVVLSVNIYLLVNPAKDEYRWLHGGLMVGSGIGLYFTLFKQFDPKNRG